MAVRVVPGPSRIRWALVGFLAVVGLFGCNRQRTQLPNPSGGNPPAADTTAGIDTRLTKSFEEAITENPLPDWIPEATTSTGKSIGKLYTDVQRLWKEIPFTTPDGKPISYRATLETDLGSLEIAFFPNLAPNHVRNFVALARAGYYDGLVFERIISINQETDPDVLKGEQLDYIEGGGPLGPIKPAYDSLGYWLKPEIQSQVGHEEGTVGACRGQTLDSAACKFYITLGKPSASLNGNYTIFGKVVKGIDVARKIHSQPVVADPTDHGFHIPEKPVVIRKVTIQTREGENAVPKQDKN